MRFTTALLISCIVFLFSDVQAQPSLLEKRFRIDGPDYEYDDLQFLMEFEVSDFIKDNMLEYKLYDGMNCKDGGDNDITDNDGYLLSRIRTDNTPNGDGTGSRKVKVHSQIVGNQIKDSDIYRTNDDGDVLVEYCLRFGVYNQDKKEPMSFETNFLEIPVRLTIDMVGDFSIIAPLDVLPPILTGEEQGVAVEAYICDSDDNTVPIMPTEQGQTIRVCVSPVQEVLARNIVMRQIEQFTFRREIPDSVSQEAIEAGTGGVAADPLTVVSCRPGSVVCAFETLLTADFFSSPGIIIGKQRIMGYLLEQGFQISIP